MRRKVLVIDDDQASCRLVRAIFAAEGVDVEAGVTLTAGLALIDQVQPDVILLDLNLPDGNGLEVLPQLRSAHPDRPVLMLTAHQDVKSAVRATQLGAFNYLTKPIDPDDLVCAVQRAVEHRALKAEVDELRRRVGDGDLALLMGPSRAVASVIDQVKAVAASNFSVLILGETGTGKELVAQAIHKTSARHGQPFSALDCGAIPEPLVESELFGHERGSFTGAERRREGRFQSADGGTLFLDEIGNLPLALQAKLLRVLESKEIQPIGATRAAALDVRIVAATNDDLRARTVDGRFRADLYYRLAQYVIVLPPLRTRVSDIAHLARRFLEEVGLELRRPAPELSPESLVVLEQHGWPGNVRELRNVIRQSALHAGPLGIEPALLRDYIGAATMTSGTSVPPAMAGRSLRAIAEEAAKAAERQAIGETLRATGGNKSQAAKILQTDYKTLHVKMKLLGMRARDFED